MIFFIETADRVFEVECLPDTPGWCRRTMTVKLASGKPLTEDEWLATARKSIEECRRRGIMLHGVEFTTIEEDEAP